MQKKSLGANLKLLGEHFPQKHRLHARPYVFKRKLRFFSSHGSAVVVRHSGWLKRLGLGLISGFKPLSRGLASNQLADALVSWVYQDHAKNAVR